MTSAPLRVGISRCLLGDEVRFDGGHKRDHFLTDVLGAYVEWVPVCPEVEAGLGIPRDAMRLVGDPEHPRLLTINSRKDHTWALENMTRKRLEDLADLGLSGFVFKRGSPSCGVEQVRVYTEQGLPGRSGTGIFAGAFVERFPLIPVEEEGRLCDPPRRENFIERLFCYCRFQELLANRVTRPALVRFHTVHKYLLMAHSRPHYQLLGRLVDQADRHRPQELAARYGELFMKALAVPATVHKHVKVLQHLLGYFKDRLGAQEKSALVGAIDDYHRGLTPLIVPVTLLKHYVRLFDVSDIGDQIYLNPHPKELMLRNHV